MDFPHCHSAHIARLIFFRLRYSIGEPVRIPLSIKQFFLRIPQTFQIIALRRTFLHITVFIFYGSFLRRHGLRLIGFNSIVQLIACVVQRFLVNVVKTGILSHGIPLIACIDVDQYSRKHRYHHAQQDQDIGDDFHHETFFHFLHFSHLTRFYILVPRQLLNDEAAPD